MVDGATPSTWNFGWNRPSFSEITDLQWIFACSASAVTPSEKSSINTNRTLCTFQWAQDEHHMLCMLSDTNIDGVTERYVLTLEQHGVEWSASSSLTTTLSGYHREPSCARATTWLTTWMIVFWTCFLATLWCTWVPTALPRLISSLFSPLSIWTL